MTVDHGVFIWFSELVQSAKRCCSDQHLRILGGNCGCLQEGASCEGVQHAQGSLGLVQWHHVSRLVDAEEVEIRMAAELSYLLALDEERLLPGGAELRLVPPVQSQGPLLIAQPVADEILVPGIDQDVNAGGQHRRNELMVVLHEVKREGLVDDHVAALEVFVHAKLLLNILVVKELHVVGHVVTQRWLVALDALVIGVHARSLVWDLESQVAHLVGTRARGLGDGRHPGVATCEGSLASRHGGLESGARHGVVDHRRGVALAALAHHVRIPLVLLLGVGEAVPDAHALEIDLDVARR
mmetsp:Transcript_42154/g.89794  ORF Transcript_42154/g.89794 Transcript_42154/m.89794 type:complete len:298 (-) Transcript_42154:694-1587(-)